MASASRKAWNDAMRATASAAAIPSALAVQSQKRRSNRQKSKFERRSKARKVLERDSEEYRTWLWMDALEGVDPLTNVADDDEEFDDVDENINEKKRNTTRGRSKQKVGAIPKRILCRSLGAILLDEVQREDGAAYRFLESESLLPPSEQVVSKRKFCPVTGLDAIYTDPKSEIPFSSMSALEQIQERPPPWMTLNGSAGYWETIKSIQDG